MLARYSVRFLSQMRILNVAEKNDAAKNIAKHLSNNGAQVRNGLSQFNKIYEFKFTQCELSGSRPAHMIMTSVSGHLLNLKFPDAVKNWKSCDPAILFDAPVESVCPKENVKVKETLERESRLAQALIVWTDCDREGENIGFEVISVCQRANPSITVHRARFSEITERSVKAAIANLQEPDVNCSDAVEIRKELDLRIGAAFTRFQTLRFQVIFPELLKDALISYGSCQFPTLGFVVERFNDRENFVREKFWYLEVRHAKDKCEATFHWKRGRVYDHHICTALFSNLMNDLANRIAFRNIFRISVNQICQNIFK